MADTIAIASLTIGDKPVTLDDIVAVARRRAPIVLSPAALARVKTGYSVLEKAAAGGQKIYGVTTGLGAAVDTKVESDAVFQQRVPLARSVGVGKLAETDAVRAMMAVRIARLSTGVCGMSPATCEGLVKMLNKGVHPLVPLTGSLGESDLPPLAAIGAVLFGAGKAEFQGKVLAGDEAMNRAKVAIPLARGKDGLGLVNSNAASLGLAALALADAKEAFAALVAASALTLEGFRASLTPFDPRILALRPVPGQAEIAQAVFTLFEGGDLVMPGAARRLQDPLSIRCIPPVHAACLNALKQAEAAIQLELNTADDNPAVLAETRLVLSNSNFDTTHLVIAFEALGLVFARVAAMAGERLMKLMSPATSDLPRFLTKQDGRTGFGTLQKTIAALVAEIQHAAMPMPAAVLTVADRIEDYATMSVPVMLKTQEIVWRIRVLAAIECIVAAQAVDLREKVRLGSGTGMIHAHIRSLVPTLTDDRPSAPDIETIDTAIRSGAFSQMAEAIFKPVAA